MLVEERTVTFEYSDGLYTANFPSTFEATVGETYKVSWDAATYECACIDFYGNIAIGNLSITGEGSDTGEPFLMAVNNGSFIQIFTADTSASHTFSISSTVAPVVKIDKRYLPSTIPFMEDGKIPEKYVQERFPDVHVIFGGVLVISKNESTIANPYPNKTTLGGLTVEAFNVMLNDENSRPKRVMVGNNVASVSVDVDTINVSWSEFTMYGQSGKPLAGASVRVFKAKIHEDTNNPGTIVSECAVVTVATKALT